MAVWPFNRADAALANLAIRRQGNRPTRPSDRYALLRAYYDCNALYQQLETAMYASNVAVRQTRPLRNPAYRVVENYVAHVWGGPIDEVFALEGDNADRLQPAVDLCFRWSNWAVRKQLAVRVLARDGDLFLKVAQTDDRSRVYQEILDPAYVTDFDTDERGYVTYLRLDVPVATQATPPQERVLVSTRMVTEVWSKGDQQMRRYEHDRPGDLPEAELGQPVEVQEFGRLGIDFVPIVHAKFRDLGNLRGQSVLWPLLDKIDEANYGATRLAEMLFRNNRALWTVTAQGSDQTGRPLPALKVKRDGNGPPAADDPGAGEILIGDDTFFATPGGYRVEPMVPNLNYQGWLDFIEANVGEIEKDEPTTKIGEMVERAGGQVSGRAIRFALTAAVSRIEEARANADDAELRALQMQLTIGANAGIPQFAGLGRYEDGAFDVGFKRREVVPISGLEEAQATLTQFQALLAAHQSGVPLGWAAQRVFNLGDDEAAAFAQQAEQQAATVGDQLLAAFDRGGGTAPPQPPRQQPPPPQPAANGRRAA